ncbi:SIR2 family protein [Sarcina ventriculi]
MKQFIKTSIKNIRQANNNNKLVIFIGAGVSANSGYPSWTSLVKKFGEEIGQNKIKESLEEYLKIPQCYFEERGEKEYFDLIDKMINSVDALPNDINRIIFDLGPACIITTNFDDLLEKTVKEKGLLYTTVKQDKDLPYSVNDKMIIKMHGDGKLKNIVLKESDYLNYSRNFALIENYIKGLFSTKTILFVGYSAEDPDFKLLFETVKQQLGGYFQPAYLLETNKKNERIDFNYYKNRGINILYYDEIENEINKSISEENLDIDIKHELGIKLYKFLMYIRDYRENYSSIIDYAYYKLSELKEINIINPELIVKTLGNKCSYNLYGRNELMVSNCNELLKMINKFNGLGETEREAYKKELLENYRIKEIFEIFINSNIYSIEVNKQGIDLLDFIEDRLEKEYEKSELYKKFKKFKYNELNEKLNYYLIDRELEGNENYFLEKAYYLYNLGSYVDAYNILRKLASHCFSRKKYYHYFIVLFNMKQLKVLIEYSDLKNKDIKYYNKIMLELSSINIQDEYMNLPLDYQSKVNFILNLDNFNYFYKKIYEFQKIIKSLKEQKSTIENGGMSINNNLSKAYSGMKNIIDYINGNYLMVTNFVEIRALFDIFSECMLINYSIDTNKSDFMKDINCNISELDNVMLDIIIRYVKSEDLEKYLSENNIRKIKIEEEDKSYLVDSLKEIKNIKILRGINKNKCINNVLLLLSYIDINEGQFNEIVNSIIEAMVDNILDYTNFKSFKNFISYKFKNQKGIVKSTILIEFINIYIQKLYRKSLNGFAMMLITNNSSFFNNLSVIISKCEEKNKFIVEDDLLSIINNIKTYIENKDLIDNLIMPIYFLMSDKVKDKFKQFISKSLSELNASQNKYTYINLWYSLCVREILIFKEDEIKIFIEDAVEYIEDVRKKQQNTINGVFVIRHVNCSEDEEIARIIINLIKNNKIKYEVISDKCKELEDIYQIFKFFMNMNEFNYENFKLEWLNYLSDNELIDISKNREGTKIILEKIFEYLKHNTNKRYMHVIEVIMNSILEIQD